MINANEAKRITQESMRQKADLLMKQSAEIMQDIEKSIRNEAQEGRPSITITNIKRSSTEIWFAVAQQLRTLGFKVTDYSDTVMTISWDNLSNVRDFLGH